LPCLLTRGQAENREFLQTKRFFSSSDKHDGPVLLF